jgi:hypothetical protein
MNSDWATLFLGKCEHVIPTLADASVDAVVCDPPYGTTRNLWDAVIPFDVMWSEIRRVVKPDAPIVMTASQPFSSALVMSNPRAFKHEWVWEKNKASGHLNAKRAPMKAHEVVLVFCHGSLHFIPQMTVGHRPANRANRRVGTSNYGKQADLTEYGGATVRYPRSVQAFDVVNNDDPEKIHPTQKPVDLIEYVLRSYTEAGQVVLDFAMGSGTTGVACANLGRKFIGIEDDPTIFAGASRRILEAHEL